MDLFIAIMVYLSPLVALLILGFAIYNHFRYKKLDEQQKQKDKENENLKKEDGDLND